jgi:hypothetical protein
MLETTEHKLNLVPTWTPPPPGGAGNPSSTERAQGKARQPPQASYRAGSIHVQRF